MTRLGGAVLLATLLAGGGVSAQPALAYVLQGRLEVTDKDTGQEFHYKPGDVVIEVIGQRHFGYNTGDDAVRLIVFDTLPLASRATSSSRSEGRAARPDASDRDARPSRGTLRSSQPLVRSLSSRLRTRRTTPC